jgi:hypothetical protein
MFQPQKRFRLGVATLIVSALLSGLGAIIGTSISTAAPSGPVPMHTLGIFRSSGRPDLVGEFERWLGHPITLVEEHLAFNTWAELENPGWFANQWRGTGKKLVITVEMLPAGDGSTTIQQGASGAYNYHYANLARNIVGYGFGDAILRVGHEFNCCYAWGNQAANDPQAYINYFRQIVTTMRSVPGANFTFDWNPILGQNKLAPDRAYPGDAYVDVIGMDTYDDAILGADVYTRWNNFRTMPYGLNWLKSFSSAHGKPMSFPEWAPTFRPTAWARSGGDNAWFIEQMFNFIQTENVLYAVIYNHDNAEYHTDLLNGTFPNASAKFRQLWGPLTPGSTTTTTAAPTTTTAAPTTTTTAAPTTLAAPSGGAATTTFVSDLNPTYAANGWGPYERDRSNNDLAAGDGRSIKLAGTSFSKGLGVHAGSDLRYSTRSDCTLTAQVGVDDEMSPGYGSVVFEVWNGTSNRLYQSPLKVSGQAPTSVSVPLTGVTNLRLVVTNGGDTTNVNWYDHGDWANASLACGTTTTTPAPTVVPGPGTAASTTTYLSDMNPTYATNGWGPYERDRSNNEAPAGDGHSIKLAGTYFSKGLGVHAASDLRYTTRSDCTLTAQVGVDDEMGAGNGSVVFEVWNGTTNMLYQSPLKVGGQAPTSVSVPLTGVTNLRLVVTNGGDTTNVGWYDHGDWANATVRCGA